MYTKITYVLYGEKTLLKSGKGSYNIFEKKKTNRRKIIKNRMILWSKKSSDEKL